MFLKSNQQTTILIHRVNAQRFIISSIIFFYFAIVMIERVMCLRYFVFALLLSVVLFSCKKYPGPSEPVVDITSPSDTTIINAGDTVIIKGVVSDNKSLHEVYFTLAYSANDSALFSHHPYTHGRQAYPFEYLWITSDAGSYKFVVEAQDHDGHLTKKEFPLVVH
jgi:hypothetical protein